MARTILVWSCIVVATLVLGALALATSVFDRKGKLVHIYARLWARVALQAAGVNVKIEGLEKIEGKGPFVFMANHQGSYDIFSLLGHLPFQFKWLAKKELFSIPFFGWTMRAAGYISIDRQGTRETVRAMNEAAEMVRRGVSVVIFPEGSRSADGSIQPFKKGGFTLAIKAKVPIVPIAIHGSRNVMPKHRLRATSGTIRVRIDEPISTEHLSMKDRSFLMEEVRNRIQTGFNSISRG